MRDSKEDSEVRPLNTFPINNADEIGTNTEYALESKT